MSHVLIALGSNIEPEANLRRAMQLLASCVHVIGVSSVYETQPVGKPDQPNFLNAAALIETELGAAELKTRVLGQIERELGRVRTPDKNAPRTIDLDITLYGSQVLQVGSQHIPDPDLLKYPHVAVPAADVAPTYLHPETGQTLREIADDMPKDGLMHRTDLSLWETETSWEAPVPVREEGHMLNHTIVIGAGLGGLSAAIHLAAAGQRVTVLERNPSVGGKAGQVELDGFRWDTGPTVITLQPVLSDLFARAGRRIEDYLTLVPIDPLTRYHYPDGTILDINTSLARTVANIERVAPRDVDGYLRFLSYAARMHRIISPVMLYRDPPALRDLFSLSPLDMAQVDLRSMDQAIRAHVRSPYLRQIFRRFATYLGASPYAARAYLNVIAHVELTAGLWYPRGGTFQISLAYRRLAEELGVGIRTETPVARIVTRAGRAVGAELADGTMLSADAIIANVDPTIVYRDLLPELRGSRRLERWMSRSYSCSGFVLLLGIDRQHPHLAHHNIFFSSDYRAEFSAIFERGLPPVEPTVYVAITSKTDPAHAPTGCENWYVMVNTPPISDAWDWAEKAAGYRDRVLDHLALLGLDIRAHIQAEHLLTPPDIERLTGAWRGALYGHSFNNPLASFQRPSVRSPDVQGLYFAGGATHPAGGVPMVTLSGRTAGRLVLRDIRE